jgi:methylated-DNA-[protein]-cysteine S-methyltransferase
MDIEISTNSAAGLVQTELESPVGTLQLIASNAGVRALLWPTDGARVRVGATELVDPSDHKVLLATKQQLEQYFAGTLTKFDLPLDPIGTTFQLDAWRALTNIGYGKTASYAEQASKIGRPKAVRAVGAANGKNPISIIVPCHRVIGSNGSLTGFAAGVDAKRWLLDHERRVAGESLF